MPNSICSVRLLTLFALGAALPGCGDSGTAMLVLTQNRIDVAVAGLPAGVNAAIVVADATGRTVATLTTAGEVFVAGPGKFTVVADPVLAAGVTYTPTVSPATLDLPEPPSVNGVSVAYAPAGALKLGFVEVASGLAFPTFLASPPGSADIYVVEQPGRVRKLANGVPQPPTLDISARVGRGGERGMLSLAFDPQFAANGHVFVYFTDPGGDIAVERFTFPLPGAMQPPVAPESTAVRVITIPHATFANHNGGQLQFGPDGMLYLGTGDGGSGGDPLGSGQDLGSLLGKIVRIDVSSLPYKVPADNPFVGQPGRRQEIWAYGLRNPWRFAFDSATNRVYIADVGQENREEVNVVSAGAAGLNYGWNRWEGRICYPAGRHLQQRRRHPAARRLRPRQRLRRHRRIRLSRRGAAGGRRPLLLFRFLRRLAEELPRHGRGRDRAGRLGRETHREHPVLRRGFAQGALRADVVGQGLPARAAIGGSRPGARGARVEALYTIRAGLVRASARPGAPSRSR